jgi:hypothetical protein
MVQQTLEKPKLKPVWLYHSCPRCQGDLVWDFEYYSCLQCGYARQKPRIILPHIAYNKIK